jgi:hypothetical protein
MRLLSASVTYATPPTMATSRGDVNCPFPLPDEPNVESRLPPGE